MINAFCNILRNNMSAHFKRNNLKVALGSYSTQVLALYALIPFLKIYNQSLIYISFQHIDLDAW